MRNMLLCRKFFLIACLLAASAISFAQVTQKWVKRENGDASSPDNARGLVVDPKGNVIVTGGSTGAGFASIKYDGNGGIKWIKKYTRTGQGDEAVAIAADQKCNVYVSGWSNGNGTGEDYATIKYDENGNSKWIKRFNGSGNGLDEPTAIAVDEKGNVYVTGFSTGAGTGSDITTIKYDNNGNTRWVKSYSGPGNNDDHPNAIAVDKNGNVYVTGYSSADYATIKYDYDGHLKWIQKYNGSFNGTDIANAITVDDEGNAYVTGFSTTDEGEDGNPDEIVTIKYNAMGSQQWLQSYRGPESHNVGNAIALDRMGNVYLTGITGPRDLDPYNNYVTVKYNTDGVQQWDAIFQNSGHAQHGNGATGLVVDSIGNVYITGGITIGANFDYATVKYNTNGVQLWAATYDAGLGDNIACCIGIDKNGNVFITGTSLLDYATIKYSGDGVQKWVKRYDGAAGGPDIATALAVDKDGNTYVTGGITRNITGLDFTTYKYDSNGNRIWKKTYNGAGNGSDQANAMTLDANGNVYVTGASTGSGTGFDYATIKYDRNGNSLWGKRYNGPGNGLDQPTAIAVDKSGNVYVTGGSESSANNTDYATIKYDSLGNIKWIKRYNGPGNFSDRPTAIAVDNSGNVHVTGRSAGTGNENDYATIKYGANGNELWVARYDGGFRDDATALATDALGNVYVTGRSFINGTGMSYATIKYNTTGVQQWLSLFRSPSSSSNDQANDIAVDASGNVYVTGVSADDFATVKYNPAGVQQWATLYNGPNNSLDIATTLALDASGNVYVSGRSEDYATVKYNSAGEQQWVIRYDGPGHGDDVATALALDVTGNVYVTGQSVGNGSDYDYATIKYQQATLVTMSSTQPEHNKPVIVEAVPAKLNVKAFPNAFTDFVNLQWSGSDKPVTITITDATGRLVEKMTGLGSSGSLKVGNNYPQGIFFAEVVQGTDKILLKLMKQ